MEIQSSPYERLFFNLTYLILVTWFSHVQENYNTSRYRTPQAIPLPNYERIPGLQPVGKGCSGCVPVRCVETTLDYRDPKKNPLGVEVDSTIYWMVFCFYAQGRHGF